MAKNGHNQPSFTVQMMDLAIYFFFGIFSRDSSGFCLTNYPLCGSVVLVHASLVFYILVL